MDVFGPRWEDYIVKIRRRWLETVTPWDSVVIPGDISWAMTLEEARIDLEWLADLPGQKVLLRGNHDYWWSGISKVRRALPQGLRALQNDHLGWYAWAICGSRGWTLWPGRELGEDQDRKLWQRELQRLQFSLESAVRAGYKHIVAALHYPPLDQQREDSDIARLFQHYPVKICVYGHLHGEGQQGAREGWINQVYYRLVAADAVEFRPVPLLDLWQERLALL